MFLACESCTTQITDHVAISELTIVNGQSHNCIQLWEAKGENPTKKGNNNNNNNRAFPHRHRHTSWSYCMCKG